MAAAHRTGNTSLLFDHLKLFSQIVVTGPQRSGTTICAAMIAHDLGYQMIDETQGAAAAERGRRVNHLSTLESLGALLTESRIVIQAPSVAAFCHQLPVPVAVVFMIRPVAEILRSQERIAWKGNNYELKLLNARTGHSCVLKYERWRWQKPLIQHAFEIEYQWLSAHPLWVDAARRTNFSKKQIMPDAS